MTRRLSFLGGFLGVALLLGAPSSGQGEKPAFALIGNPGNPPDGNGYGSVKYRYKVQQTRVTNGQYARFLNTVAPKGESSLYHGKMATSPQGGIILRTENPPGQRYVVKEGLENKPVAFASWQDAARYANWLNNGANASASTESGAYDMAKAGNGYVGRSPGARFWIPSRNELYKATFYTPEDGGAYTRDEPRLPEAVAEGRLREIVEENGEYNENGSDTPIAVEDAEENDAPFCEESHEACEERGEEGFRIACRIDEERDPKEVAAPVAEGPETVGEGAIPVNAAPGYFLMSPFINPTGVVLETRPEEAPTPEPSPTPVS